MKRIIIVFTQHRNRLVYTYMLCMVLSSLVSCNSKPDKVDHKEVSNPIGTNDAVVKANVSGTNKELVLKMYEEFDKGKLADFALNMAPDFKCNVLGNTDLDWAGFIQFGNGFLTAFPDGKHNFDYVIVNGENVVTIGTYTGTHLGHMQGIAPTKARIALPVMHLDRVVEGKIVEHRGLANQVQFMSQLGFNMVPQN
jgi:predicted ester cyclase